MPHSNPLGSWEPATIGGLDGGVTAAGNTAPEQVGIWHTRTGDVTLCPYGVAGNQLWVRETFSPIYPQDPDYNEGKPIAYDYAATYQHGDRLGDSLGIKKTWKPSIHMPRAASRITLEITGVRVERLQDISEADAIAEGIEKHMTGLWLPCREEGKAHIDPRLAYRDLWESINGTDSWDKNPWVWAIAFQRR